MNTQVQVGAGLPQLDAGDVFAERVRLLYANAVLANLAVVLIDLVVTGWYWDILSWEQLALWWGLTLAGTLYRLILVKRYPHSTTSHLQTERWVDRYLAGTGLVSLGWGVITAFGLASADPWDRAMAVLLVTGIMGSSVSTLGSVRGAVYFYNLPPTLVALGMLLYHGGDEAWVALALFVYTVLVMYAVHYARITLDRSLTLRFGNQRLARDLGAAKERAEDLNRYLRLEVEERKRAQEALEEHKRNLETVVEQRTAELVRARDAAEAASRAKSRFLAAMSHEIRTPLNGVQGTVELLGRTRMSECQRIYVDTLGIAAGSLLEVVNQILDFSRIEAGGLVLARQPLDAGDLVERTCAQYAGPSFAKGVELVYRPIGPIPSGLLGDAGRLGQILGNLLSNAVKFTDRGQILVRLWADSAEPARARLHLEVEDTGPGIPAGQEERIFASFAQADESDARSYEGTGLGLAIARELVAAFGGEIGVRAAQPRGAVFWFTAVLERSAEAADDSASEEAPAAGRRMLVADDNGAVRESLADLLRGWGAEVDTAEDRVSLGECLACAGDATPFDILFCDRFLSGRDDAGLPSAAGLGPPSGPNRLVWLVPFGSEPPEADACGALTKPVRREALKRCLTGTTEAEPVPNDADVRFEGLRVLVAEDNALNQMVIREMLTGLGCRPQLAVNGAEALEILERETFDLILMDCRMPVLDGYRATQALRQRELARGAPRIPVVALTANATEEEQERALNAGMDGFLGKPATVAALSRAIRETVSLGA
jgi:signal transduction histidine kinase/DNA-binding response OmpR family regulator